MTSYKISVSPIFAILVLALPLCSPIPFIHNLGRDHVEESCSVFSHVILFSWDGVQYNHLMELYNSGNLINLKQIVNETRLPILRALITDHYTETNYGHPSLLSGVGQGAAEGCPDNITVWENIEAWDSSWITASIAAKAKFSDAIFPFAKDDVDFWYANNTNANAITDLAIEFMQNYSASNFFLFVHYREPDSAGHAYGENSQQYSDGIIECDNQIGRILSALETEGIRDSTAIIVTTDHGFVEGGTGHSSPAWGAPSSDPNCYTVWIASDNGAVDLNEAACEYWDQNDVAPSIYSLIGLNDYESRWPYIRGSALWERNFDVRDVSITDVQLSKNVTDTSETRSVRITVFFENQGDYTEIPSVSVYYSDNFIGTKTFVYPGTPLFSHGKGASVENVTLVWNVENVAVGTYTIIANIGVVSAGGSSQPSLAYTKNETDTTDNAYSKLTIVTISGDATGNFKVDMKDVGWICKAYDSTPEQPKWNPNADINDDGKVDMKDIGIACQHYGEAYP